MIPQSGDQTIVTADDIDWSLFDPARVDFVRDTFLGGFLAAGTCTNNFVAAALVTYADPAKVSVAKRSRATVDISPAVGARAVLVAADAARDQARADFHKALREVYREGATAPALASALDLSVVRVNQLVAGARG